MPRKTMAAEPAYVREPHPARGVRLGVGVVMFLCLSILLAACGGSSSSSSSSQAAKPTTSQGAQAKQSTSGTPTTTAQGSWRGTWRSTVLPGAGGAFEMRLTQSGPRFSGPIQIHGSACISTGTDQGVVTGNKIRFGAINGNQAVFYAGTVHASTMSGTYGAPGCSNDKGTWQATRSR